MRVWKLIILVGLFGWSMTNATISSQESTTLIPRHLLFGNPEKTHPRLSPNGQYLAYLAPDAQNVLNVWLKNLKTAEKDRQVTTDKKRGIRSFLWQFDGDHILYEQDKDGDENWHLYQTHIQSNFTRDLTPYEGVKAEIVQYDPKFPQDLLVQLNLRNPQLFDVYRLDLQTRNLQLDTENQANVIRWVADHNLCIRIAQSYNDDGSMLIRTREGKDQSWKDFLKLDASEINGEVYGFTADNRSIYLISSLQGNTAGLLLVDLTTGKQNLIVDDPVYDLSTLMTHPTTYALEAVGFDKEKFEWKALDYDVKTDFSLLSTKLNTPFKIINSDLANQKWVIASLSDQRPVHYYLYERQSKFLTFLFSAQSSLENFTLSAMSPICLSARDGMKLYGYLTLPHGKEPRNLPMILLVHGGPWARDSWGLNPTVQWLANRGYAVVQLNYRGSSGYGKHYLNAGNREWSKKMHTDLLDAKQWMIDQGYVDPHKVAIYGGSYGGYATLVGLTFTPDEFCCGVDIVGPSNLVTLLQTLPPYWAPLKAKMELRLGNLDTDAEFLKACSPLFKVDQIKKPLLIAQGANDPRVKQSESDQIVKAMREKNLPVEYLLFPDEGHGFARPENRLKFAAAAEDFLVKYLGGRSEPASSAEDWKTLRK
ncbi:Dipeptidyl aminopeptidase BIII [Candidatus Protochlamydia amoebophila]|uniref:S9 family peptidase n=1 Tax=Candidatus Protochlamydia amoebophila TaxID=362787 RepID=UPI001BCA0F45|nr:S9 family peptidase [Candidatus Protochlamydia amoebophila]MBS4164464.1 Dipeptidyl aminopeptidase BIII [Candidatus Protochlamydia amoebophila]